MNGARPVVKRDEDSPRLGEKLADHVRLSSGAGTGVVIVEGGDHLRLLDQEGLVVDVCAVGPEFKQALSLAHDGGGFTRPRCDGGVKAVAVREENPTVEEIEIVGR